jgi:hypothetical protein
VAVGRQAQPGLFDASINDLAAIGVRMFFGYGDANFNLGEHIPIEMRFFTSPEDPSAQAALIGGAGQGAPQTTPTQSGGQIDRYRLLTARCGSRDRLDRRRRAPHAGEHGAEGDRGQRLPARWRRLAQVPQ